MPCIVENKVSVVDAPGMKARCEFCGLVNHMWANIRCSHFNKVLVTPDKKRQFEFVLRSTPATAGSPEEKKEGGSTVRSV